MSREHHILSKVVSHFLECSPVYLLCTYNHLGLQAADINSPNSFIMTIP